MKQKSYKQSSVEYGCLTTESSPNSPIGQFFIWSNFDSLKPISTTLWSEEISLIHFKRGITQNLEILSYLHHWIGTFVSFFLVKTAYLYHQYCPLGGAEGITTIQNHCIELIVYFPSLEKSTFLSYAPLEMNERYNVVHSSMAWTVYIPVNYTVSFH